MTTALAILYFLGIFLHYLHVIVAIVLVEEVPDKRKVVIVSLVWPAMTIWYFYHFVLKGNDDEY